MDERQHAETVAQLTRIAMLDSHAVARPLSGPTTRYQVRAAGCRRRPRGHQRMRNIITGVVIVGASTLLTLPSAGGQTTQAEADRANADLKRARVAEAPVS